jgi:hypothetical protein
MGRGKSKVWGGEHRAAIGDRRTVARNGHE